MELSKLATGCNPFPGVATILRKWFLHWLMRKAKLQREPESDSDRMGIYNRKKFILTIPITNELVLALC